MIATCAVYSCNNNTTNVESGIQFFSFPKNPIIAQQWISACWRSEEELNLETARVCSIHFDASSYTYKMMDYLGLHSQVLKYDAVPTLYLPNPLVLKPAIHAPLENETLLQAHQMKPVVIYELQNIPCQATTSNFENENVRYITTEMVHSGSIIINDMNNKSYKQEENSCEVLDQKQNLTPEQLEQIKRENELLQKEVNKIQDEVDKLSNKTYCKLLACKRKNKILRKLISSYYNLKRNALSHAEQKEILSKVFSDSQIKILTGKKKIYWSEDDMAVGYTIRHLCNKQCYTYLTKKLNIPLPALSSIKRWSTLKVRKFEDGKKQSQASQDGDDFIDQS